MNVTELLGEALKLPPCERQAIAEQLWQSLDSDTRDLVFPIELDPEFQNELRRRVASVLSGQYESVSFEESIALARSALAKMKPATHSPERGLP